MKMTPWFTHPQAILGVYDFLLSVYAMSTSYVETPLSLAEARD